MNSRIFKGTLAVLTLAMLVMAATPANAAIIVTPDHIVAGSATGTLVAIDVPYTTVSPTFGGPTWTTGGGIVAHTADQGFTAPASPGANDGIREPHGSGTPWEPDGTPLAEAKDFFSYGNGPAPSVTYNFNLTDSGVDVRDGSIIFAIYATFGNRGGGDGATYQYTEGAASDSNARSQRTPSANDLVLRWTDSDSNTHDSNFELLFSGPITVEGGDGFQLWATDNIHNAAHIDAAVIDYAAPSNSLVWDNNSDTGDGNWETATNWDPSSAPTSGSACTVDHGDTVSLATAGQEAFSLDLGASTANSTLNVNGELTVAILANVHANGTLNVNGELTVATLANVHANGTLGVTGTLSAAQLNTSGAVTIGPAATMTGTGVVNIEGGTVTGTGAMNLGPVNVNGGTLAAGGTVTTTSLTYNSGSVNLGGNALNTDSLTVNGNMDVSNGTVSATDVTVNNATLTVGNAVPATNLTIIGGNIAGAGTVNASTKVSLADVADYSKNITGSPEVVIGEDYTSNHTVKLSGANTYSGDTTIRRGWLEVAPDAANIVSGTLVFNVQSSYSDHRDVAAVLQSSGSITRTVGTGPGQFSFPGRGGFAATDSALTVTLDSYPANMRHFGSTTSSAPVTIVGDLTGSRQFNTWDNETTNDDMTILNGNLDLGSGTLSKYGRGLLWLQGTTTATNTSTAFSFGEGEKAAINDGGLTNVIRAVGDAFPVDGGISFTQGVIETNNASQGGAGALIRQCENNALAPKISWRNRYSGGGFAAYGGPLDVKLIPKNAVDANEAGGLLTVSESIDLRFSNTQYHGGLYLGSAYADNVVTFHNPIQRIGGRVNMQIAGNPDVDTDWAVMTGDLNFNDLYVYGAPFNPGEVKLHMAAVNSNVYAVDGVVLGGDTTITGRLRVQADSSVAPGLSIGTLTVNGNVEMQNDSIYEWEVGQPDDTDVTDVLNITGGTLNLDNFVLKILGDNGYVADAGEKLPVFTYSGATIDMGGFTNNAANFDTSALDETWTIGTLSLEDGGAGIIYLTGLSGGVSSVMVWDGGPGKWSDAKWGGSNPPVSGTTMSIDGAGSDVAVTTLAAPFMPAGPVTVTNAASLAVESDATLTVNGDVAVDADSTLTVDGILNAEAGTVAGTLAGNGLLNLDPITVTGTVAPGTVAPGMDYAIGTLTVAATAELWLDSGTYNAEVSLGDGVATIEADQILINVVDGDTQGGIDYEFGTLTPKGVGRTNADFHDRVTLTVVDNPDGGVVTGVGDLREFGSVDPAPADDASAHFGQGAFLRAVTYPKDENKTIAVELDVFVAMAGDADGDGLIGLLDWGKLRNNFGQTGKDWTEGNFDSWDNGTVDLVDWGKLRDKFGQSYAAAAAGSGAAAVPEPATIAMLLGGLACLAVLGWRRRRA